MTLSTNQLRRAFLEFFARNGHAILPSSPLVPHQDPTLMFTNSGMVQFKNIFTGAEAPPSPRATTAQKCVRAGGKHNDLDNVGYTARHHTFFEMLGNFSFADYFKEEAIPLAWEFLTKDLGLPKEKLLVTVYHDDEDAAVLWKKVAGFSDDKIIRIHTSDNFWAMGDTGPCGPCSEIFYDHGDKIPGGPPGSELEDGDRFIEIWNLVFMQYEQVDKQTRNPLPKPCIDTGMGLERISAVLQGVHSNYEIDTFRYLIAAVEQKIGRKAEGQQTASFRVIADHLRSACFLLADGVMPSNEGRGYVLRRIMRRAMRHVQQLGYKQTLMHQLVPTLITEMGEAYPELHRAEALMRETLKNEEERFRTTLDRGLHLLGEASEGLAKGAALPGDVAFKLYDTYGFPVDLTADILRGQNKTVDMAGFEAAMQQQKALARAAWSGSGEKATGKLWFELRDAVGTTEFLGYQSDRAQGTVTALVKDGVSVKTAKAGEVVKLLANQTPFYGESGGQVGDIGTITTANAKLTITDTQKPLPDVMVHEARIESGEIAVGETITLAIDVAYRKKLRANHSATHLLHAALRKLLGEHVTQQGSSVAADRFRFDFSYPKALTTEQMDAVEREVNRQIWGNTEITTVITSPEEAVKHGALALFGEKYGDEVRVLSMGQEGDKKYSVELCGGTHATRTGDIGVFVIAEESAVAAGVRRIEGLSGEAAFGYLKEREASLQAIADELRCAVTETPARVVTLLADKRQLEKDLSKAKTQAAMSGGGEEKIEQINGIAFLGKIVDGLPAKELRGVAEQLKAKVGEGIVTLITNDNGKASVVVSVAQSLTSRISAVTLVQTAVAVLGGQGGGGRPDFAQGGGSEPEKAESAMQAVRGALKATQA